MAAIVVFLPPSLAKASHLNDGARVLAVKKAAVSTIVRAYSQYAPVFQGAFQC